MVAPRDPHGVLHSFEGRGERDLTYFFQDRPFEISDYGIVYDGGRYCALKGTTEAVASLEKITEKELEEIRNDFDPIEAPPGPYKVQPEKQGTCQLLLKVYFDLTIKCKVR